MVLQHRVNTGTPLKRRSGLERPQASSALSGFCKPKVIYPPPQHLFHDRDFSIIPSLQLTPAGCSVVPSYAGVTRVTTEVDYTVLLQMHWMNSFLCVLRSSSLSLETSLSPQ